MGMETVIAQDCIDPFVDLLEKIGPTERISLLLHTNGGPDASGMEAGEPHTNILRRA